jgi:hypothetical protein
MLVYPQLTTGALTQFPVTKRRRTRTVINTLADMTVIKLADPAGETIEWQLQYAGLSDAETANLQQFYLATEGSLNVFTFVDPTANLLSWSDQLTNDVWTADPFLGLTGGLADPTGGTNGWTLNNSGEAPQGITQTLNAPAGYTYCFSVYVQSTVPSTATLLLAGNQSAIAASTKWTRVAITGQGESSANSIAFKIQAQSGAAINIFGMQVEAQPAASVYKSSTIGGVYNATYFQDGSLAFTSTDINRNSVTVNIVYASTLST